MELIEQQDIFKRCSKNETYIRLSGIYMITNLVNGKKYVGQSSDIHRRWIKHTTAPYKFPYIKYDEPLYDDMRKYGISKFQFQILERVSTREGLNEREVYWIEKIGCLEPKGYNKTKGGDNVKGHLSEDEFWEIVKMLKDGIQAKPIMERFGISVQTVTDINVGRYRRQQNIEYPIRKPRERKQNKCESCGNYIWSKKGKLCKCCKDKQRQKFYDSIARDVKECGNKSLVARKYKVSQTMVRKWLAKSNVPFD